MGKHGRFIRSVAVGIVLAFLASTTAVMLPRVRTAAALASGAEEAIASGIQQLVSSLQGLDDLDQLDDALPFTDMLPTGPSGLGLDNVLQQIDDAIGSVTNKTAQNVEDALNALNDPTIPGLEINVDVDAGNSNAVFTFNTLKLTKTVSEPLKFLSGDAADPATFSLGGGNLDVNLAFTLAKAGVTDPFVVGLDIANPSTGIFFVDPPQSTLTASLSLAPGPLAVRLGILDVAATGTVSATFNVAVDWLDPDASGTTTLFELTNSAATDLFNVTIGAPSTAAMNLTMSSTLTGLVGVTGTVTYSDDLTNSTAPVIGVNLGALGDFTNMTPQDVLAALAQLVISLRSMQVTLGNIDLPLVDENFAEFASWADKISKLFTANGLSLPENPIDLQISPESGTECGDTFDNDGDGTVDDGCPGQPSDLEAKGLATIEDIIAKLGLALTGASNSLGLAYNPATHSVTFTIRVGDDPLVTGFQINNPSEAFFQRTPEATLNVADELAKAGITGLNIGGSASISITPKYGVNLVVGLDLSNLLSDPALHPITERVFIEPQAGPELTLDVPVKANLDLSGRIGLLKLALADNVAGTVDLLARRASDTGNPMLRVDLSGGGTDGRLTLKELFDSLSALSVTTAANTLTLDLGGGTTIVGTLNVGVPQIGLNANATIGSTALAAGEVTFAWPDLTSGTPTVGTNGSFNDNFGSFNLDPNDPLAMFSTVLAAIDSAMALLQDIAGGEVDTPLPIIGTSLSDLVDWLTVVQDTINSLADNPAGSLELLELTLETAIAEALDAIDGVDDFVLPTPPATSGLDAAAYQAAVEAYAAALATYVSLHAGFVNLEYVPGSSPGDIILHLNIGVCSDKTTYASLGCTFERELKQPFNLVLPDSVSLGGLISADANGEVELDYNVSAKIDLGIELPVVTPDGPDADFLPQVSGLPRVFLLDSTGISASVMGSAALEFGASIGPFDVQAGETDLLPETGAQCTAAVDDDGDGVINDGCPTVGALPEGVDPNFAECTNATDDDSTDADAAINDGCPAVGNALVAKGGATFTLLNNIAGTDRAYLDAGVGETSFAAWLTGLNPVVGKNPLVDCVGDATPGVADFACAHLPIYFGVTPNLEFLGNLDVTIPNFDLSGITVNGAPQILAALQAAAEGFVWDLIAKGIKKFGEAVDEAASAASYDVQIPVIGDLLDAGADIAKQFKEKVTDPLSDLITTLNSAGDFAGIEDGISDFFWTNLNGAAPDAIDRFILHTADVTLPPVQSEDIIVTTLCKHAAADPAEDCVSGPGAPFDLIELVDVQVQIAIGQAGAATTPDFDWGVPGLRLSGNSTLTGTVSWRINLGFGISLDDGFYLMSDTQMSGPGGDEIAITADVDFGKVDVVDDTTHLPFKVADNPDAAPALTGDLAFIGASLWNNKEERINAADAGDEDGRDAHEVHLSLGVNIPNPSLTDNRIGLGEMLDSLDPSNFDVHLIGKIDLDVLLATTLDIEGGAEGGAIPRLLADLSLTWGFDADIQDGMQSDDLVAGFDNIRLDLGSFISEFLAPALKEVQRYTKPLQPIIDTVQAPIPGVSQLAELVGLDPVTLMDLFELVSSNDLTMIRRLLDVISLVNSIPTDVKAGEASLIIPLGSFDLDSSKLSKAEVPANVKGQLIKPGAVVTTPDVLAALGTKTLGSGGGAAFKANLAKAAATDGGFSFPAFKDPSQLFQLLVGKDVTLVEFDAGKLKAETGWSQSFGPITIGPIPVSIVVSISASIEGRFVIGYDTKGIRQLVQILSDDDPSNNGFFDGLGALLAGVYIGDLAADGSDPPEIRLVLEGAVGAALDLVVVKVGIEAGLRATLDLNLHDGGFLDPVPPENLDGKLRIDEIITFLHNPLCLFDVSGKLEAFIRVFVTIDFFLFSVTFKQTIINIVLLELKDITKDLCKPPPPVLANEVGNVLYLNMGPRIGNRDFAEDQFDEKFVVRQVTEGTSDVTIRVSAFGIVQDYPHINKVVGDGGDHDDSILAEEGAITGVCQPNGTLAPEVAGYDCDGDTGDVGNTNTQDDASEGQTVSKPIPFAIPLHACGGDGEDKLGGGAGNDKLIGNGSILGDTCTAGAVADGSDDFDKIAGQGGDDQIWGNDGDDSLSGDSGNDTINGGDGLDEIIGGIGRDILNGDAGGDSILGGPEKDPCPTGPAKDEDTCSLLADDTIHGGADADNIEGDHGKDTINGDGGTDTIVGGLGNDTISGDGDADNVFGNQGNDTLNGNAGDDDVVGGAGNDTMNGGADNDDLTGQEGNDTINGDGGLDVILGDMGVINRDPAAGSFNPSAGKLLTELTASAVPPAGNDTINGGADADMVWGQEGTDTINGNDGDDILRGNAGADTMSGNGGADEMYGDADDDTMYGDSTSPVPAVDGVDTMRGGDGADTMSGNAKGDKLFGDAGADTIFGDATAEDCANDLDDTIYGGPNDDYMFGNAGSDTMFGEGGIDRMVGGNNSTGVCDAADVMLGGPGDDVMAGDNATIGSGATADLMLVTLFIDSAGIGDNISGEDGDDRAYGQTGIDIISGGAGADAVEGNDGADTINGDDGNDDLVGGGSANDGIIDANREGDGLLDGIDIIHGGGNVDWIAGDNALVSRNFLSASRAPVELFDVEIAGAAGAPGSPGVPGLGTSAGDTLTGDDGIDEIFGQGGNDLITGGNEGDYIEGNHGDDNISGNAGADDLVGGGSANDGEIDGDRVGNGLVDGGETLISGGTGIDWIAGDNALVTRNISSPAPAPIILFDVETGPAVNPLTSGGDTITGDADGDRIFGQGGSDGIHGNDGNDYVEGNHAADTINGDDGNDDLIGGGSANDGRIDDDRVGNGLKDLADVVEGDQGVDLIAGDNAIIVRNIPAFGRIQIELFDVDLVATTPALGTSGGDTLRGGTEADQIFGQGGDDFIDAGAGTDYAEGNHGNDNIIGGDGDDDLIGGGSANDGVIDDDRIGNNLEDKRDTITGNGANDWVAGDNAIIARNLLAPTRSATRLPIELFDVQLFGSNISPLTSGGDIIDGNDGSDRLFGQGNGDQNLVTQTDPGDGRNNNFVGSAAGPNFDRNGLADESVTGGWKGDVISGGLGDDAIEGNHGNDLIFGNALNAGDGGQDEDDIVGGGSADDGVIDDSRLNLGANLLDGADTIHGDSTNNITGDDDAITGDNAWVVRLNTKQAGPGPGGTTVDQWNRDTRMTTATTGVGTFGNDFISGNGGHDELFGQGGNDYAEGGYGSDAIIGDLGKVTTDLLGNGGSVPDICAAATISPNEPFIQEQVCQPRTLFRLVQLYAYDDTQTAGTGAVVAGSDVLLGLDGDDWIHGGAGADLINGDGDGGGEIVDPNATYTKTITDPNPATLDADRLFGGDSNGAGVVTVNANGTDVGNGDAVWGGRGRDHSYGGRGDDMLDVRPDALFPATWQAWAEADVESYHGVDFIYGGYDQDAMQANVASNGPVTGDRLFDWVGAYNIYYLCPATYGAYVSIRDQSPAVIKYFEDQARTDGAFEVNGNNTSGARELAMVYKPDVKNNTNPIYPGQPGHFFCGS